MNVLIRKITKGQYKNLTVYLQSCYKSSLVSSTSFVNCHKLSSNLFHLEIHILLPKTVQKYQTVKNFTTVTCSTVYVR